MRTVMIRLWTQVLMIAFLASAANAQPVKRLWVLQESGEMVEYDAASFTARRTTKVPLRLLDAPEHLGINAKGVMLFLPPQNAHGASGGAALAGRRVWLWDGHGAKEWSLEGAKTGGRRSGEITLLETVPQCFLSVGSEHLFWFEKRFEKITDGTGLERSVRSSARVWRTDLAGGRSETIADIPSDGWCQCPTGTCSETCPEWDFWAPDGIVGDFFLVTRYTEGQLGPTYHESHLYQHSARTWRAKKLPGPVERPLDASEKGEVLVAAVPDGGCCGWDNESNDQTLLLRYGKVYVLFDEFKRYGNPNYDVSFFTSSARLAPGSAAVAYTIVSSSRPGDELRLSSRGKESAEERARLRGVTAELPAVEVVWPGIEARPKTTIRRASLVGWLSEHEILVEQGARLVVVDLRSDNRKETPIRVRSAADAFLR